MSSPKSICVFCGSRHGKRETYTRAARAMGRILAENGIELVFGGGGVGLMGEVANATMEHKGRVTGIIPEFLRHVEPPSYSIDELIVTETMHERKANMYERSDAFCVLPGGIGTLEEVVEMISWAHLKRHAKPIVFVNIEGFWDPFLELLEYTVSEGFAHGNMNYHWDVVGSVDDVLPAIENWRGRNVDEPEPKY